MRGIELGESFCQDDQAYAPDGWTYGDDRRGVPFARLRTVHDRHVFTLKRPAENVLPCEEHETAVTDRDQMHRAVVAMGFRRPVRIVKTRRTGTLGDMALCVDELDGLGVFRMQREARRECGVAGKPVTAGLMQVFAAADSRSQAGGAEGVVVAIPVGPPDPAVLAP